MVADDCFKGLETRGRSRDPRQPLVNSPRYVAYYRVSTPAQERSGLGLEAQHMSVREFLANGPGEIVAEVTEIESGRKNDRPKLNEALRLCRLHKATLVIARLDRLSRNVALIAKLMVAKTQFVVADMPEANRFTLHIFAAVAEYEAQLISERVKAACAAMKARGVNLTDRFHGRLGDRRHENLDAANAAQAKRRTQRAMAMAPLLVQLRDDGKSLHGIAVELNRLGIEPPKGGRGWKRATVRTLFCHAGQRLPLKGLAARQSYVASLKHSVVEIETRPVVRAGTPPRLPGAQQKGATGLAQSPCRPCPDNSETAVPRVRVWAACL